MRFSNSILVLLALVTIISLMPIAFASPDVYLKDSPALGVTTNPGKLMDFIAPTRADPASLATLGGIEYYWYSPPYFGTIPGPKAHSFHLYYKGTVATTITVTVCLAVQLDGSGTPVLVSSKTYILQATSTVTHVKIPDVIVIPETTLNGERIKLSLSTGDPITIYFDGINAPSVLNSIPRPPPAVGGDILQVNTALILAPTLLRILSLVGPALAVVVIARKIVRKRNQPPS